MEDCGTALVLFASGFAFGLLIAWIGKKVKRPVPIAPDDRWAVEDFDRKGGA